MAIAASLLFALFLLPFVTLIARNDSFAFYFLVATTPLSPILPEGVPFREIPEMIRYVALLGVIGRYVANGMSLRKLFWGDTVSRLLLLWIGIVIVSFLASGNYSEWAMRTLIRMVSYLILYFVFRSWIRTKQQFLRVWQVISWVVLISAIFGIVQVLVGDSTPLLGWLNPGEELRPWDGRATSFFLIGPNSFAGFMNVFIPVDIAYLGSTSQRSPRYFHGLVVLLGFVAVILSGSRGAVVALGINCILATFCFTRKKLLRIITLGIILIATPAVTIAAAVIMPRLTHVDQSESVDTRYVIWGEAYRLFQSHPVLGIGMGNFRERYDPNVIHISSGSVDVHNLYLQLLTETGVIGLAVFLVLCGYLIRKHLRKMRQFPIGSLVYGSSFAILATLLAVLIHGAVDFLFIGTTEFGAAFFIMLALSQSADRLVDNSPARARKVNGIDRRNAAFEVADRGAAAV